MAVNQLAEAKVQNITSMVDLFKPQELTTYLKTYNGGLESNMYLYLHTLGFEEKVGGEVYYHTEKNMAHASLLNKTATTAQTYSGTTLTETYTLDGDSASHIYVRVGDAILYKGGDQAIVTAVDYTAKTFTVSADSDLPAVAVGETLIIFTRVFGAGSNVGRAAMTNFTKYSNHLQIIKEKVSTDSSTLTQETWVNFGKRGVYSVQLLDGELRMMRAIDGAMKHGKYQSTIPDADSETGANRVMTQGLIPTAKANGTSGTLPTSVAGFDDLSATLISNGVKMSTPIWSLLGLKAMNDIENIFLGSGSDFVTQTSNFLSRATDNKLFKASEVYGVFANFKYLNKKYTYQFEVDESWSDPSAYGATGYDYDEKGILIPIRKDKDGMSGKMFGTIGMRYKSANGLNRRFMVDSLDGFGSVNGKSINEVDLTSTVWLAHVGAQFMGSTQYIHFF